MGEDLMEKLLTDFDKTLEEFNELVRKNDFDGVKRTLEEVNRLIQERNGIVLDDREPEYDHVLHELLSKMEGIVTREISTTGIDGIKGSRYYTNEQVREMLQKAEEERAELKRQLEEIEKGPENEETLRRHAELKAEYDKKGPEIANLRASIVEGTEYSTLTFTDPELAELQEERAKLVLEKMNNLREIARLRGENTPDVPGTPGTPGTPEDPSVQARIDEINNRISEIQGEIPNLEERIEDIRNTSISQLISNLSATNERRAEIEAMLPNLREQLRAAGDRVRETRGFDEANAQAQADFNVLTQQINALESELNSLPQQISDEDRAFLESLVPSTTERENVLDPMDYTYMGRLSDEQIIRRLLSEQLHLSDEEIEATIGEYSLVQADEGAHDEYGEDEPIAMRQLVRNRTTREDKTVGDILAELESQLYRETTVDHTREIEEIDSRIAELDRTISEAEERINEIRSQNLSNFVTTNNPRRAEIEAMLPNLREQLRAAGDRVRETRGFDEANAQAQADFNALTQQINALESELNSLQPSMNDEDRAFLESLMPTRTERENVLDPMDYTYMGRLSDEQIIRRLLSEQLHLSDEEIEATIGEYSLVQADEGAHDEYGEDEPVANRQLVRTRTIREDITVNDAYEKLASELQEQIDRLKRELEAAARRIEDTKGFDEANAQAHADYNNLVAQISELENQLRGRQARFNDLVGIKNELDRINSAKEEQEQLRNKRKELEEDKTKEENPEVRAKIDSLKGISGIAALEAELNKLRDELAKLEEERDSLSKQGPTQGTAGTQGKPGVDNSERIAQLQARNNEIINRIGEIDRTIGGKPGAVPIPVKLDKETINVEEEAHRIGDHIFKTAAIRRELASREITRDEFLAFYQAGLDATNEQLKELEEEFDHMKENIRKIAVDPEGDKSLTDQLADAKEAGDEETKKAILEKLRNNMQEAGLGDLLQARGLDHELTSDEDIKAMEEFLELFSKKVEIAVTDIKASIDDLGENKAIFEAEIQRLKDELETIKQLSEEPEKLAEKTEARKKLRRELLEASITPESELTEEQAELLNSWNEARDRFLDKKTKREYTYTDKSGATKTIQIDTIDVENYPEYADDVDFLGVPDYKQILEQISIYRQTSDPYAFGPEIGEAYDAAERNNPGSGAEVIERVMADKEKYIDTFNGIPNPYKVRYENYRTAGSTLKGMKPVDRNLPAPTRAKNAVENVFRFLGIRAPKFTKINEHGEEVRDVAGGAMTLATDALVVGAVGISAATVGPALAVAGYAAKGLVTIGNRIAARIVHSRHAEEIDNNIPVLNQANRDAREVARKEYYREHGDNRFVAWVKAKADKYITRRRGKETEMAIVDELATDFETREDERLSAMSENVVRAHENQVARMARQRQVTMGANTYNDIVRDPDQFIREDGTFDESKFTAAMASIARNAALLAEGKEGQEDVNKDSKAQRKDQYVKAEGEYARTNDLDEKGLGKNDGPVSALTAEQIYTGEKQHRDRWNRVITMITAGGLKFAYNTWKNSLRPEVEEPTQPTSGEPETTQVYHPGESRDVTIIDYEDKEVPVFSEEIDPNMTLGDIIKANSGKDVTRFYSVSGGDRAPQTVSIGDNDTFTAGWFNDGSKWGTGISDTHGLTAPELTERLANASSIGANGVLRQDMTLQEMADQLGCTVQDIANGKVAFSLSDRGWVYMDKLIENMPKIKVQTGTTIERVPFERIETKVMEGWYETVPRVPDLNAPVEAVVPDAGRDILEGAGKAFIEGAAAGAAVGVAEALHEAAQTTYIDGNTPGRPDEVTPEAKDPLSVLARKLQEEANREREAEVEEPKKKGLFSRFGRKGKKEEPEEIEDLEEDPENPGGPEGPDDDEPEL